MTTEERKRLKKAMLAQRKRARQRGISWQLTEAEWFEFWEEDDRWRNRGTGAENFVMSRKGDVGPYSIENIVCQTQRANGYECRDRAK